MAANTAAYNKLAQRADRAVTALSNLKQKAKLSDRRMLTAGEGLVGGAVGGLIDGRWGGGQTHEVLGGIPSVALLGGGCVVAGLSEAVPGGEDLLAIGTGLLSYAGGNYVRDAIKE
jgi:hypothetical protein